MAELVLDVVEQKILVRLDAEDLIRCKSVCKSWKSIISSPLFVKAHLNHTFKSDRNDPELGHRRIGLPKIHFEDTWFYHDRIHIVGSCNGLLCFSPIGVNFVVTNPLTREHRELPLPPYRPRICKGAIIREAVCWGFGYDSCADDYKVIVGFKNNCESKWMLFYVITLKSNVWKFIGRTEYHIIDEGRSGIFCGGALHWFMTDKSDEKVIIALDLSTEKFNKVPLPHFHLAHDCDRYEHRLGVIEECLCIYSNFYPLYTNKWVMKHHKWELYVDDHCHIKHDLVHYLQITSKLLMNSIVCVDGGNRVPVNGHYIRASLFVKSLVSPHSHVNHDKDTRGR